MKTDLALAGAETRQLVETMINNGMERGLVVLRHSARHYDMDNPLNEPFMGLTEDGKQLAYQWTRSLPPGLCLNFFSSFIGRCIETAYLMDKGYVAAGGRTVSNMLEPSLSPFYVRDALQLYETYLKGGEFLPTWLNGAVPADIIDPPEQVAKTMSDFWAKRLSNNDVPGQVDICITHDWNLYVLRWHFLKVSLEKGGKVDYLDGMIVFKEKKDYFVTAPGLDPTLLRLA